MPKTKVNAMLSRLKSFFKNTKKGHLELDNEIASKITETTRGCYWEWDVTERRLRLVPDGILIFGKSINTSEEFMELLHPYDVFLFKKKADRFFVTDLSFAGESDSVEFRVRDLQGEWKWFAMRRSRVDSSLKTDKVVGSILDVDEYKCAIELLHSSEAWLKAIFKSAPGSMAVMDTEGKLVEANQAFYDMLGYSAKELQGVFIMSLSSAGYDTEGGELMAKILSECEQSEDKHFRREEDFTHSSGERITVDYGFSAIYDVDGNIENYIFSGVDVTPQIKHAAELKLLTENQQWLFTFLSQINQLEGIAKLFAALKENLPCVISFSSLKLIVPSFLDKSWVFDSASEQNEINGQKAEQELSDVLNGSGPLGHAYVNHTTVNLGCQDVSDVIRSTLAIPLVNKGKSWGVLALESCSGTFCETDVMLMKILVGNIGIYFEEQTIYSELDLYTRQLHHLHSLIHSLLLTHNRDHLLEGMLGYIKSVIPGSSCAAYLFDFENDTAEGAVNIKRLAWYEEDDIPVPDNELSLKSVYSTTPLVEYTGSGLESRRVSPIVYQSRTIGAVDLYKPIGFQPMELKMYQLLIDYVSSFWVLYDMIEKREEEASVDPLTGIWNRRYMITRFQEEAERISRYGGNACVVIGDMGNFKQINDEFGHSKGDEVLIKTAKVLKKSLRISDSVGRYGGDEFIMLLPNISKTDVQTVLDRIQTELDNLNITNENDVNSPCKKVILDFGVAAFPGEAPTLLDTINLADEEMYSKKADRKKKSGISLTR